MMARRRFFLFFFSGRCRRMERPQPSDASISFLFFLILLFSFPFFLLFLFWCGSVFFTFTTVHVATRRAAERKKRNAQTDDCVFLFFLFLFFLNVFFATFVFNLVLVLFNPKKNWFFFFNFWWAGVGSLDRPEPYFDWPIASLLFFGGGGAYRVFFVVVVGYWVRFTEFLGASKWRKRHKEEEEEEGGGGGGGG